MKCDVCQKDLDGYQQEYFEITLNRNYQSQGYPATGKVITVTCCSDCHHEAMMSILQLKMQKQLERSEAT